jgi:hypothetical protein
MDHLALAPSALAASTMAKRFDLLELTQKGLSVKQIDVDCCRAAHICESYRSPLVVPAPGNSGDDGEVWPL